MQGSVRKKRDKRTYRIDIGYIDGKHRLNW